MTKHHSERYAAAIELLREARKDAGLTQAALAERLGSRQQFVSKYESGERRLDVIEYLDIADALCVDTQRILEVCISLQKQMTSLK